LLVFNSAVLKPLHVKLYVLILTAALMDQTISRHLTFSVYLSL